MLRHDLKFVGIAPLSVGSNWSIRRHSHAYHELIVLYQGTLLLNIEAQNFKAGKGDILFYRRGISHEERMDSQNPIKIIYIGWEGWAGNWDVVTHDSGGRVRMMAEWLLAEEQQAGSLDRTYQEAFLDAMLAELIRIKEQVQEDNLSRETRSYMREHLAESVSLNDLAREACMSKFHFLREYKRLTGSTPMKDLQAIRIRAARDRILTTDLPLKSIAIQTGFTDAPHLSRVFKKYLDVTPSYFREKRS